MEVSILIRVSEDYSSRWREGWRTEAGGREPAWGSGAGPSALGMGGEQVGRESASLHIPEQCFLTELAHTRAALEACCAHLAQLCVL